MNEMNPDVERALASIGGVPIAYRSFAPFALPGSAPPPVAAQEPQPEPEPERVAEAEIVAEEEAAEPGPIEAGAEPPAAMAADGGEAPLPVPPAMPIPVLPLLAVAEPEPLPPAMPHEPEDIRETLLQEPAVFATTDAPADPPVPSPEPAESVRSSEEMFRLLGSVLAAPARPRPASPAPPAALPVRSYAPGDRNAMFRRL